MPVLLGALGQQQPPIQPNRSVSQHRAACMFLDPHRAATPLTPAPASSIPRFWRYAAQTIICLQLLGTGIAQVGVEQRCPCLPLLPAPVPGPPPLGLGLLHHACPRALTLASLILTFSGHRLRRRLVRR